MNSNLFLRSADASVTAKYEYVCNAENTQKRNKESRGWYDSFEDTFGAAWG